MSKIDYNHPHRPPVTRVSLVKPVSLVKVTR
jgi:hypothetical protein